MKEIKEEIVTKTINTKYEAIDGTVFNNREECIKYEDTAKCALLAKYRKLVIKQDYEWNLFGIGSEDYKVAVVKVTTEDDIKCIMQLSYLYNPKYYEDKNNRDKQYNRLQEAINAGGYIYIGIGDDYNGDCFYLLFTYKELSNKVLDSITVKKDETN